MPVPGNLAGLPPAQSHQALGEILTSDAKLSVADVVREQETLFPEDFLALAEVSQIPIHEIHHLYAARAANNATGIFTQTGYLITAHTATPESARFYLAHSEQRVMLGSAFDDIHAKWHFNFANKRKFYGVTSLHEIIHRNMLVLDEDRCRIFRESPDGLFEKLTDDCYQSWRGILHDMLHACLPFEGNIISSDNPYGVTFREIFGGYGQYRITDYEAFIQGLHAAMFNHSTALQPIRDQIIDHLCSLFKTIDACAQNAFWRGHPEPDVARDRDYFRKLGFWFLYHLPTQDPRLDQLREDYNIQANYFDIGDPAPPAAIFGMRTTALDYNRAILKSPPKRLAAQLDAAQMPDHFGYGLAVATHTMAKALNYTIMPGSVVSGDLPVTLAMQKLAHDPVLAGDLAAKMIHSHLNL